MKLLIHLATLALTAHTASAALCSTDGLLGLGASIDTTTQTFALQARDANGTRLTVVNSLQLSQNGFYQNLSLGQPDEPLDSSTTPLFTFQSGVAFAPGGTVLATRGLALLFPLPLALSADVTKHEEQFALVNASCDGTSEWVLRFTNLLPVPIGSAAINGSFAPGTNLASPILDGILTLGTSIDLLMVPHNASSAKRSVRWES